MFVTLLFLHLTFIEPIVPYYISVVAVNQIAEGNSATATVFTKVDSKLIAIITLNI